jgi:hypothetical protein
MSARVQLEPAQAWQAERSLEPALNTLRDQPFGVFALIVVAVGLIIFGVYGLCEARWRQV